MLATAALVAGAVGYGDEPSNYTGMSVLARNGDEVLRFSGIRFADAPVGDWRWRKPRPVDRPPADVPMDATTWPPACVQDDGNVEWYQDVAAAFGQPREAAPKRPDTAEDCLFLNIWTPDERAQLPVMVWIHGGANVNGWSFEPNYRGRELAAMDAVVVSIQYRLGVFGFLAHPALSAESPHTSSGNYGILDQIEALRWIQANIAGFGGDPDNVTLFGESAGAGDIAYLLLSPLAEGLFHRAISQVVAGPQTNAARLRRTKPKASTSSIARRSRASPNFAHCRPSRCSSPPRNASSAATTTHPWTVGCCPPRPPMFSTGRRSYHVPSCSASTPTRC